MVAVLGVRKFRSPETAVLVYAFFVCATLPAHILLGLFSFGTTGLNAYSCAFQCLMGDRRVEDRQVTKL